MSPLGKNHEPVWYGVAGHPGRSAASRAACRAPVHGGAALGPAAAFALLAGAASCALAVSAPGVARAQVSSSPGQSGGAASGTAPSPSSITVRVSGGQGAIFVDGQQVGQGEFSGELEPGLHQLRVAREGYVDRVEQVVLAPGQQYVAGVTLRQELSGVADEVAVLSRGAPGETGGLYGGVHLLTAFQPNGSGSTMQRGCDTIGASSCQSGSGFGGGLSGYVGYFLDPIGLEAALFISGDYVRPSASFDGVTGSAINPVVAAPERTEDFLIVRVGGGMGFRLRLVEQVSSFRFSFALGPGLVYRTLGMDRNTTSPQGYEGRYLDAGASYLSAYVNAEAAVGFLIGRSTALTLGVTTWIENAGDRAESAEDRAVLISTNPDVPPRPQATPAYDLANGAQWFIGPQLGLAFGP